MANKILLRFRVFCRYFRLRPRLSRWLIVGGGAAAVIILAGCFIFSSPDNPLLTPAWRSRLAAAKLAQSFANNEICHEDCELRRDAWRDQIIRSGSAALFARLDEAAANTVEPLNWRIEALSLLAKAPESKKPDEPKWPAAISIETDPRLTGAAWRLFPERAGDMISSLQKLVRSDVEEYTRVGALRALLHSPEVLPANWYLELAETDRSSKLRILSLQALSNFPNKASTFPLDMLQRLDQLWRSPDFPIYGRRFLVMLATDHLLWRKQAAQEHLQSWLADSDADEISRIFIAESLNRYFAIKVSVPELAPESWEKYNQLDPLSQP